ncbi:MetQ/NlpA family ABC transporter substrate-binding protein [Hyphomicrobium sp.]|uniref:MetQ/NlpA family ABC transporter substrate-binding protein n=1 Tax=Hyphomicrobium sp. TaxID=82 RepID=UPI001DED587F|nr:MetQ/NlpA family ABC transporter substrate-binding protein [Hyphomicrobium sp.]MBY0558526.1 MetQ/NlpA family ABC transporter substrate-binding protein [Hyphomicrobium sp.]
MLRFTVFLLAALPLLIACDRSDNGARENVLRIGATVTPHAQILEEAKSILAEEGVKLEIVVFNDYVQPNTQVAEGQLDANYFQTQPYLDEFNAARGTHLVPIIGVHVEPLGAYSHKYHAISALRDHADVALPNDASNAGRSLLLLQQAGLISLRKGQDRLQTIADISENPKNLTFRELEAAVLPRVLNEVDLVVINTNYALDAGLNPRKDALALESAKSPYVNYLVSRLDNRSDPRILKLAAALTGPAIRNYIDRTFDGAVIPAESGNP